MTTDETGKIIDETEVKEIGEMRGVEMTSGDRTTDGTTTLTGRIGEILPERMITEAPQDRYERRKVHTIVQLQLLSSPHPCQNKRVKWVREIVMKSMFTNTGVFKKVLEARPQNHTYNPRPDQISTQTRQTKVTRRVRRWMLSITTTQP
jgi:hypothetical protein